jgi:predicted alpha/beta-fold hydrolase
MKHLYILTSTPPPPPPSLPSHGLSSRVWHPAIIDDTLFVLTHLSQSYSSPKIFLAGYSAGSNIVQNTLCSLLSMKLPIRLCGVFCCCVNWCYGSTLHRLENSGSLSGLFYSALLSLQVKVDHDSLPPPHHPVRKSCPTRCTTSQLAMERA